MINGVTIIAEVKTQSPFGWKSNDTWDELFEIANQHGDMLSIHTDSRWGGSFELLEKARTMTKKPILAKGIHASDEEIAQALACGADWVLVVGRIPQIYPEKCLIEPNSIQELLSIPQNLRVVWNQRDLTNGLTKVETFAEARKVFNGWLCQASFVEKISDIQEGADAVLVGTNLKKFLKLD